MASPRNEADKGEQERLRISRTKYEEIVLIEKLYWPVLDLAFKLSEANSSRQLTHLLVCLSDHYSPGFSYLSGPVFPQQYN